MKILSQGGYIVGKMATLLFPDGIEIEGNTRECIQQTNELMKKENVVLFEPAFVSGQKLIRVDILEKKGKLIHLIEVKAKSHNTEDDPSKQKSKLKKYIEDVAYQYLILKESFPDHSIKASLLMPDKSKRTGIEELAGWFSIRKNEKKNDQELEELPAQQRPVFNKPEVVFKYENNPERVTFINQLNQEGILEYMEVTADVEAIQSDILQRANQFIRILNEGISASDFELSKKCKACEFNTPDAAKNGFQECWEGNAYLDHHIFDLYYGGSIGHHTKGFYLDELIANRKVSLFDIELERLRNSKGEISTRGKRQILQIQNTKNNAEWKSPELNSIVSTLRYPLYFIDFETYTGALPYHKGMRPYEVIAFQWSCHTINQPGDTPVPVFSFMGSPAEHPRQIDCYITHTNEKTHEIIRNNLKFSAMYSGAIEGIGPRYCPSIEDKIVRFADKNSHQIFVEPEGLLTHELYPNGVSTSLPYAVQVELIRSMKGFENAHLTRPGYAIEYDFFDPRDLKPTLELKHLKNLFFAGQINGTTGYEEAAAQGLIAGINAAARACDLETYAPLRDEAYIGVLIDDLITSGTKEPYRMFTSRAEYRLTLREDNADFRLTPKGRELGLIDDERFSRFNQKMENISQETQRLKTKFVQPNTPQSLEIDAVCSNPIVREYALIDLLKRPELSYSSLMNLEGMGPGISDQEAAEQIEISVRYAGYIDRQAIEIERHRQHETTLIPDNFNYAEVKSLSNEVRQKLEKIRPTTLGEASRISGITPAAISILLISIKKNRVLVI
jgi:hypothetical protein